MAGQHVLVVEDDEVMSRALVRTLGAEGYRVTVAPNADASARAISGGSVDLVMLDLGLPDGDGLDLLAWIRARGEMLVLVLSGRGALSDRVLGLQVGADDYLAKPVNLVEVLARVRALFRRTVPQSRLVFGEMEIDRQSREVRISGCEVPFTRREFELLLLLAAHPDCVFTRRELLAEVWKSAPEYQVPATVTEHVRRIRRKIERDPDRPEWIVTVRGVGYRFSPGGGRR